MVRTFGLPDSVNGTEADAGLARAMLDAWRSEGSFRISCNRWQTRRIEDAFEVSNRFFAMPAELKAKCVSDLTYAGYLTAAEGEIFLMCPDVPLDDFRVQSQWACHGPVPWPGMEYRRTMRSYLTELSSIGDNLLRLIALGLGLPETDWMTEDGWHHLQVRKFPDGSPQPRADYGMLMISTEDTQALTVSPGAIMQFLTNGELRPGPPPPPGHTMVYFHEPSFDTGIRPFAAPPDSRFIHYGSHFTSTFIRDYPDRITTRRIMADGRLSILAGLARRASVEA